MKFDLESFDENKVFKNLFYAVVAVFLIYPSIIYFIWGKWESGGVFGDSFGMITSLFSSVAVILLILTLIIQKKEYKITQEEFKLSRVAQEQSKEALEKQAEILNIQKFENTFFKLIEHHDYLYKQCISGSDGAYYNIFVVNKNSLNRYALDLIVGSSFDFENKDKNEIHSILTNYAFVLNPYINNLVFLIKIVDEFNLKEKDFYIELILNHISLPEKGFLKGYFFYYKSEEFSERPELYTLIEKYEDYILNFR